MAWNSLGSIRGPQGPQGQRGPQGPAVVNSPIYGIIRENGRWDNAPSGFWKPGSGPPLNAAHWSNKGGVAMTSGNTPYFRTNQDGWWTLTAIQTWDRDDSPRGCGFTTDVNRGDASVLVWMDIGVGRIAVAHATKYLARNTNVYPWFFTGWDGTHVTSQERGCAAEYSIYFNGPAA